MLHTYLSNQCTNSWQTIPFTWFTKPCFFCRITKQLQNPDLQKKIVDLQSKIEQQICSDLPNVFWKRKQHVVDLPYEDTFSEKLIPTKVRPIQMNVDLEQHCRLEIHDLESKGLIQKSRSPWSCAAFYLNK